MATRIIIRVIVDNVPDEEAIAIKKRIEETLAEYETVRVELAALK